ncbi:MAG: hypothetical protein PUF37_10150 [Prevotellaceae bacterium]|uniref:hypothetical protein n=1 Tax=Prevotella sp. AGR2160 TaxID=1280674 RepID=UPI0012DD2D5D|nr:hypothetical protein [Prevotella sp. AGR2160]MDD6553928.1 hypothetical protein [Prevotellaceae bacterium]
MKRFSLFLILFSIVLTISARNTAGPINCLAVFQKGDTVSYAIHRTNYLLKTPKDTTFLMNDFAVLQLAVLDANNQGCHLTADYLEDPHLKGIHIDMKLDRWGRVVAINNWKALALQLKKVYSSMIGDIYGKKDLSKVMTQQQMNGMVGKLLTSEEAVRENFTDLTQLFAFYGLQFDNGWKKKDSNEGGYKQHQETYATLQQATALAPSSVHRSAAAGLHDYIVGTYTTMTVPANDAPEGKELVTKHSQENSYFFNGWVKKSTYGEVVSQSGKPVNGMTTVIEWWKRNW